MAILSHKDIERKVLAALLRSPTHIKALNLDLSLFEHDENRHLAELLKKYIEKFRSPPTFETLKIFASDLSHADPSEEILSALVLAKELPTILETEVDFYFQQAENYRIGRCVYDIGRTIKESLDQESVDFKGLKQRLITRLLAIGDTEKKIKRGYIYENVADRWKEYKQLESGDVAHNVIPFGIRSLDDVLGGMKKTFTTLMYSKTAGGKTRTSINVAYNAAKAGYRVMYFTLEMAFGSISNCFDSREAWIDSKEILFGKLNPEDKKKFKESLRAQAKEKLSIWLVDIPSHTKTSDIMEEIETYKAIHGIFPDLVVIDYANLVEPLKEYHGRSEKYDMLFQEFHEIARYYSVAILTATQEKRLDKASKKKNDDASSDADDAGVDNIGLSHYMAPHCENVLRLKQDKFDLLQNRLWVIIDKSRNSGGREMIKLTAVWKYTYVGDKVINLPNSIILAPTVEAS